MVISQPSSKIIQVPEKCELFWDLKRPHPNQAPTKSNYERGVNYSRNILGAHTNPAPGKSYYIHKVSIALRILRAHSSYGYREGSKGC